MMLYSIKFNFKELSKRQINKEEKRFYCSTVKVLSSKKILLFADNKNNVIIPVPTFQHHLTNVLKNKFSDWIVNAGLLNENGGLIRYSFYISIDMTKTVGDKLWIELFNYLSGILKLSRKEGDIKFFIFLDMLPSEGDVLWNFIKTDVKTDIDKGLIFLINVKDGEFLPQKKIAGYDKDKIKKGYKLLLPDNRYLLKRKLIRKLGHFQVEEREHSCHRFFYDGSYCEEEIKSLLLEYIESSSDSGKFELIIYAAKYSPWLEQSIKHLSIDLKDLKAIAFENIDECIEIYQGGKLLFITDLIYSGDSIKRMITKLLNNSEIFEKNKIHILSILNSGNGINSFENKRKITISDYNFKITYFVDVRIDSKITKENCEMCKLGLSPDKTESESIHRLKSYDFWELSDKAGYGKEKYGRDRDKLMKKIINMDNWFYDNSAYIVYKYISLLKTIDIDAKSGSIFIYPKEKVKKGTPSNRLAESFRYFFNAKEIGIPRDIIDIYKNENAPLDDIDSIKGDWIQTIRDQPSNYYDYIIIDEFHKGGDTFKSMIKILKKLDRYPKCFFPLIDFNPQKSKKYRDDYKNIQILSLYEFNNG